MIFATCEIYNFHIWNDCYCSFLVFFNVRGYTFGCIYYAVYQFVSVIEELAIGIVAYKIRLHMNYT